MKDASLEDVKISKDYEYQFNLEKIAKNRKAYPDLVAIFESEAFQPYVDFYALKDYYMHLSDTVRDTEDDSQDFL